MKLYMWSVRLVEHHMSITQNGVSLQWHTKQNAHGALGYVSTYEYMANVKAKNNGPIDQNIMYLYPIVKFSA